MQAEPAAELAAGGQARPARHDHGRADGARAPVDRSGETDACADDPGLVHSRRTPERVHHRDGRVDRVRRRVVDVDVAAILAEDGRGEIRERDPDLVVVEVDSDGDARRGVQPQKDRWTPAPCQPAAAVPLVLDDETACVQIGDEAADRRSRQPGQPGQIAAAGRSLPPEQVDDVHAVPLAQRAE